MQLGVNVSVTDVANVSNYVNVSGTSVSAATAGVATHYLNIYSSVSAETVKSYMVAKDTAMTFLPTEHLKQQDTTYRSCNMQ